MSSVVPLTSSGQSSSLPRRLNSTTTRDSLVGAFRTQESYATDLDTKILLCIRGCLAEAHCCIPHGMGSLNKKSCCSSCCISFKKSCLKWTSNCMAKIFKLATCNQYCCCKPYLQPTQGLRRVTVSAVPSPQPPLTAESFPLAPQPAFIAFPGGQSAPVQQPVSASSLPPLPPLQSMVD